jgi:isopentenyldiphosphate isomerase
MEMIEVLAPDGAATGVTKPKPDVHRDGDWHRAVHVWIIGSDGRLLVQRRALTKENNPGLWDVSCAGHVSAGEDIITAAIREAQEELGLELAPGELRYLTTLPAQSVLNGGAYIDREFHEIFVVRREVDPKKLVLQKEEVDDARIVTCEEFRSMPRVAHGEEYSLIERVCAGTTP